MRKKILILFLLIVIVIFGAFIFVFKKLNQPSLTQTLQNSNPPTQTSTNLISTQTPIQTPPTLTEENQIQISPEEKIETIKISFTPQGILPSNLKLKLNQTYNLVIENKTNDFHFMTWDDTSFSKNPPNQGPLPSNAQLTLTITPIKKGKFKLFCNLPPHEGLNENILIEIE